MQGPNDPPEMRGVIPNSFSHIFDQVTASKDVEYLVRCSYLEIYNEVIKYATYIFLKRRLTFPVETCLETRRIH